MTDQLGQISSQLARIIDPVIVVLGVAGNSINIFILSRRNLYQHSCSRYFLALSLSSLAYSTINLIYRWLVDGYQIDPARHSTFACKAIAYITQLCIPMAPYFIVLASLDRCCASSTNARIRTFSSIRMSRRGILAIVLTFTVLYANTPIVVDLQPENGLECRNRGNTVYKQSYSIVQCVLYAIVAPLLMAVFGMLTIYNAKRVGNGRTLASRHRRTESQLVSMLLVQVGSHIVFTLPVAVIYPMLVLPTGYEATRFIYFAYAVFSFPWHLSYASAFPLYFLSARIYRKELIRLLSRIRRLRAVTRVEPLANTANGMPTAAIINENAS